MRLADTVNARKMACGILAWSMALGAAVAAPSPYMAVDLRAWKTVRFFERAEKLPGGLTNALYATDCMVFRKMPKKAWYVAVNPVTPRQAACVVNMLRGRTTRATVLKALELRTGLSYRLPTEVAPDFKTFNPVLSAQEVAAAFSPKALRMARDAKALTRLSGRLGVCADCTAGLPDDVTACARTLAALKPDYVALYLAGDPAAGVPFVEALAAEKLPVMLAVPAAVSAETLASVSSKLGGKVFAWWFDRAGLAEDFTVDAAADIIQSVRTGNADVLVSFNPGAHRLHHWVEGADFTAGDVRKPFSFTCYGPSVAGQQWHVFARLGKDATDASCRYGDAEWTSWLNQVTRAGGAVTLVARTGKAGLAPAQAEQLTNLFRDCRRTKASGAARRAEVPAVPVRKGRVLYVDTQRGRAGGDGSLLRPFPTLAEAQETVRGLVAADKVPVGGVTVEVTGNFDWPQSDGLDFGAEDGGPSPDRPVVWAAGSGGARFTGAFRLPWTAFHPVTDAAVRKRLRETVRDKVLVCDLNAAGVPPLGELPAQFVQWDGAELFADGAVQTLARYPDKGWLEIEQVYDRGMSAAAGVEARVARADRPGSFRFTDPEHLRWDVAKGVYLKGYWCHDWASETLRVAKIQAEGNRLTLEGVHSYGIGDGRPNSGQKRRYLAYNFLEALDAPGEWYIDRASDRLYYLPPDPRPKELALAYRGAPLVKVENAKNFVLRGFAFRWSQGEAVQVRGCEDVTLDGLDVAWLSRSALSVSGGSRCTVTNCTVAQIGGAGVSVRGGDRGSLTPCGHRVTGCEIHHCGRLARCHGNCLGIGGCGVRVDHNELHDVPYIALNYGGNDHVIEYNEVYCAMMEGADGGGLYTGRDWSSQGNVLRFNYFHHFGQEGVKWEAERNVPTDYEPVTGAVMTMGVYLDDCDSGDTISNNVFFKAGWAMFVGGGRDNKVRNNLFADCASALHLDTRGETWNPGLDPEADPNGNDGWNLGAKLAQWRPAEEPWASRYPTLARYWSESPKSPLGTEFVGNVAVACREFFKHDARALELAKTRLVFTGNRSIAPPNASDENAFPPKNRQMRNHVTLRSNKRLEKLAATDPFALVGDSNFRRLCPDFPQLPVTEMGRPKRRSWHLPASTSRRR